MGMTEEDESERGRRRTKMRNSDEEEDQPSSTGVPRSPCSWSPSWSPGKHAGRSSKKAKRVKGKLGGGGRILIARGRSAWWSATSSNTTAQRWAAGSRLRLRQ